MRNRIAAVGLLLALIGGPTIQGSEKLRVGIDPMPPFVIVSEKEPRGFAIDIWHAVARELGADYEFVMFRGVEEKLRAVEEGKIDVAIGGITITKEREERVDFCYSGFRTGLDILVRAEQGIGAFSSGILNVFTKERLAVVVGFLLMLIIAGHLMWWVERGKPMFSTRYLPGVFEGIYWAVVTASTVGYGDKAPVKWKGQALALLVIIISLPFFAVFTAELTSSFTLQRLRTHIHGPEDLTGRDVGVVAGTTSEQSQAARRGRLHVFPTIDDAYRALLNHEVDAVVYDAPTLCYYTRYEGKGKVTVVGKPFQPQDYGYAVRRGSPLRKPINVALLSLLEREGLAYIQTKWFGEQH